MKWVDLWMLGESPTCLWYGFWYQQMIKASVDIKEIQQQFKISQLDSSLYKQSL